MVRWVQEKGFSRPVDRAGGSPVATRDPEEVIRGQINGGGRGDVDSQLVGGREVPSVGIPEAVAAGAVVVYRPLRPHTFRVEMGLAWRRDDDSALVQQFRRVARETARGPGR